MLRCCNKLPQTCILRHEPHPLGLALVLAGSQSEAGCAHTCSPSLSSPESQTGPNKYELDLASKIILYSAHQQLDSSQLEFEFELELELELEVYPSPERG